MIKDNLNIGVLGAGGWGTSLALVLCDNGYNVTLWSHDPELAEVIKRERNNPDFLPGININNKIKVTSDSRELVNCQWLVNAIPTQYIHESLVKYDIPVNGKYVVNGSKGIEISSLNRISEIFHKTAGLDYKNFAVLTGPSHAEEVSRKTPTTIVSHQRICRLPMMFRKFSQMNIFGFIHLMM